MEYSSFCILNEILFLCTSDLGSLFSLLKSRGLDTSKADQGRIHHINPEDFLIICSPSVEKLVTPHLSNILNGHLHFKGADLTLKNKRINKIEYVVISENIYESSYLTDGILKIHKIEDTYER